MITLGKRGDLHARRPSSCICARNEVADVREEGESIVVETALQKFNDLASRYSERQGGYTRILKTEPRRGDAAPMVIIELV